MSKRISHDLQQQCLQLVNLGWPEGYKSDPSAPSALSIETVNSGFDRIICPHCGYSHVLPGRMAIPSDSTRIFVCDDRLRTVNLVADE
jgi:hypothetical protein